MRAFVRLHRIPRRRPGFGYPGWYFEHHARRGCTLQELIASREILFASSGWCPLGSKSSLEAAGDAITSIPADLLVPTMCDDMRSSTSEYNVANRTPWSSEREMASIEGRYSGPKTRATYSTTPAHNFRHSPTDAAIRPLESLSREGRTNTGMTRY